MYTVLSEGFLKCWACLLAVCQGTKEPGSQKLLPPSRRKGRTKMQPPASCWGELKATACSPRASPAAAHLLIDAGVWLNTLIDDFFLIIFMVYHHCFGQTSDLYSPIRGYELSNVIFSSASALCEQLPGSSPRCDHVKCLAELRSERLL